MIYKVCIWYIWRAARQSKKQNMTSANNYAVASRLFMMKLCIPPSISAGECCCLMCVYCFYGSLSVSEGVKHPSPPRAVFNESSAIL